MRGGGGGGARGGEVMLSALNPTRIWNAVCCKTFHQGAGHVVSNELYFSAP